MQGFRESYSFAPYGLHGLITCFLNLGVLLQLLG